MLDGLEDVQWKCFFYLSLYTGARPGELIALNWQDIDLEKSTIHIRASAEYVKGEGTVRTDRPKTKSSVRDILLPSDVMQIVSLMIAEGLPIRDVAARLGHSQTSTTLDIYAHALIDSNSRATDAISRALEEARKA